jgi:XTP/dITP diphosphohydrolase
MPLLLATRNAGKVRDFAAIFEAGGLGDVELSPLPADAEDVDETGQTFLDNAILKASTHARRHGTTALADDSGLEVDALGGAPGVHTARFAALHNREGERNAENNKLLLEKLQHVEDRAARFVCVLAVADATGRLLFTARGTAEGRIATEPRGDGGFGYDPLFELGDGRTMAELSPPEKAAHAHRGHAARRLVPLLKAFW